jgi:SAM-dependent methyltransferase
MPFSDNTFDLVFSICVIEHIPMDQQTLAIGKLYRVLKPGGKLAITFDYVKGCEELSPYGFSSPEDVNARLILPGIGAGFLLQGGYDYTTRNPKDITRGDNKPVLYGSLLFQKQGTLKLRYEPNIDLK